jgi:hypothetical protein
MDVQPGSTPAPDPEAATTTPSVEASLSAVTADWPVKAADAVDQVVSLVHDRFIRPVMLGARALVFGLLILALAVVLGVTLSVSLLRFLDVYLFPGQVWASYLLLGGLFTIVGIVLWAQRNRGGIDPAAAQS